MDELLGIFILLFMCIFGFPLICTVIVYIADKVIERKDRKDAEKLD